MIIKRHPYNKGINFKLIDNNRVIGTATLKIKIETPTHTHFYFSNLEILPTHRGQGLGTQLLKGVNRFIDESPNTSAELWNTMSPGNTAYKMYEKTGWEPVFPSGVSPAYLKRGNMSRNF